MKINTKSLCACETNNEYRLKFFIAVLLLMSVIPAFLFKAVIGYNDSNYEDVIVIMPKMENAKEYTVQIDDNLNFISPILEKKIPGDRKKMIFRLEKKKKPYYWRYQVRKNDGLPGEWQNQLELRSMVPAEDKLFLMEGKSYRINEPLNFYFYARNDGDMPQIYEYSISIRSEHIVNNEKKMEVKDIIFGKVSLGPRSSKVIRTNLKTEDDLEVNKKYYVLATLNEYKTEEDFYIEPSYMGDILTKQLENGTGSRVQFSVTNNSNETIRSLKVNISTSYNIKVEQWWDNREVVDLEPGKITNFQWDVEILEPGNSEINIDVFSDGGTQRLRKVFMPYSGSLVAKEMPDIKIYLDEISDLKIIVANASEVPYTDPVELSVVGYEEMDEKIEILNKIQAMNVEAGSDECAMDFSGGCSVELAWKLIAREAGTYEYYLRSKGYDVKSPGSKNVKSGKIYVRNRANLLNLTINGEDTAQELRSGGKGPFNYDISVSNSSSRLESVKLKIVPKGRGWYVHLYEGKVLKDSNEFEVKIEPNASKDFRLVLNPRAIGSDGIGNIITNPFEVLVFVVSLENADNNDEISVFATIE